MSTADWRSRSIFSLLRVVEREQDRVASVRLCIQSIATGIECGRDCKTSPYKFCTGLSINLYPQKIGNTDPVRETRSWYNLIGEAVQSLYGLLFEQSSPSIPVAIDCTYVLYCTMSTELPGPGLFVGIFRASDALP